jgi:hypothetical protein
MLSRQRVVVPALEQRNVLRGRVWGRLVQAEVLLKHDADQGLIQVDQVCLHTLAIACSLHRLICPRPRGAFLALTAILTPAAPSPRAKRSSATTSRTTWSEGARTCRVHCLASWRGAAASGFSRNQLGAAIGYRAADVEPRWAAGVDDALRATPWQSGRGRLVLPLCRRNERQGVDAGGHAGIVSGWLSLSLYILQTFAVYMMGLCTHESTGSSRSVG